MKNIIDTTIIDTATANATGFYKWFGAENDCQYYGEIPGYVRAFCVEVRKDNALGYSSVVFVPACEGTEMRFPMNGRDYTELGLVAEMCVDRGYTPTGRIVFRGYYTAEWDADEYEEYFVPASDEVVSMWNKWVKSEV